MEPRQGDRVVVDGEVGEVVGAGPSDTVDDHHRIEIEVDGDEVAKHVDGESYADCLVARVEDLESREVRRLRVEESTLLSEMARMKGARVNRRYSDDIEVTTEAQFQAWRELTRSLYAVQSALEDRGARTADVTPEDLNDGGGI